MFRKKKKKNFQVAKRPYFYMRWHPNSSAISALRNAFGHAWHNFVWGRCVAGKSSDFTTSCWVFLKKKHISFAFRSVEQILYTYTYIDTYIYLTCIYTQNEFIYIYNIVVTSPGLLFSHFGSFWLHKKSLVHLVMIILGKVSKAWRGKKSLPGSSLGRGVGMDDDKDFLGSRNTPIF